MSVVVGMEDATASLLTCQNPSLFPEGADQVESCMADPGTFELLEQASHGQAADRNVVATQLRLRTESELTSSLGLSLPPAPWDEDRPRAIRSMVCLCSALASCALLENTFTLYAVPLAETLHSSGSLVSVAFTILVVTYAFTGPFFSRLTESRGASKVMLLSIIFFGAAHMGLAMTTSLPFLYVSYFLAGLGEGCLWAPCVAGAVQLMPQDQQPLAAAIATICFIAGSLVIAYPVQFLMQSFGLRIAYLAQGLLTVLVIGAAAAGIPDMRNRSSLIKAALNENHKGSDEGSIDELEQIRDAAPLNECDSEGSEDLGPPWKLYFALYGCYVSVATIYYMLESQVLPILQATLPANSYVLEIALPSCLFANVAGRLLWGLVASSRKATLSMAVAFSLVLLFMNAWGGSADLPFWSLSCAVFALLGASSMYPLMPVTIFRIFDAKKAFFMNAVFTTADGLASVIGAPFASVLADHFGWPCTLHLSSVLLLACLGLLLYTSSFEVLETQGVVSKKRLKEKLPLTMSPGWRSAYQQFSE